MHEPTFVFVFNGLDRGGSLLDKRILDIDEISDHPWSPYNFVVSALSFCCGD